MYIYIIRLKQSVVCCLLLHCFSHLTIHLWMWKSLFLTLEELSKNPPENPFLSCIDNKWTLAAQEPLFRFEYSYLCSLSHLSGWNKISIKNFKNKSISTCGSSLSCPDCSTIRWFNHPHWSAAGWVFYFVYSAPCQQFIFFLGREAATLPSATCLSVSRVLVCQYLLVPSRYTSKGQHCELGGLINLIWP